MREQDNNKKRKSNIPQENPSKAMDSKKEVEQSPDERTDQDFPGYPHYPAREDIMDQRTDMHRLDLNVEDLPDTRNVARVRQSIAPENSRPGRESNAPQSGSGEDFRDINPRTDYTPAELNAPSSGEAIPAEIGVPQNVENPDLGRARSRTDLADEDRDRRSDRDADVSPEERAALETMYIPTNDEENLRRSAMDTTDFEGDQLNEDSFGEVVSGADLDVPEETDETGTRAMGQGDEENRYFSLGGDRQDPNEEDPYSGPARG